MLAYLHDDRRFHACFLVHNASKLFTETVGKARLSAIRESISIT
jgi:hypothetical protein